MLQGSSLSFYRVLPVDLSRDSLAELGGDDCAIADLHDGYAGLFDLYVVSIWSSSVAAEVNK